MCYVPHQSTGPHFDQIRESWPALASFFVLACVSGALRYMGQQMSWRDTFVGAGASGVGGFVVGALCVYFWGPEHWYLYCALTPVAGWLGGNVVLDRLAFVAWTIGDGKLRQFTRPKENASNDATDPS